MMNVLVLSHTSVLASYRRKWEILSSFPNVQLTLVIPDAWPEASLAAVRWDGRQPRSYRILCVPVWFRGRKGHITRYCFPRTPWILLRMRPDLIHVDNEPFSLSAFLATLLGRCLGSRIVFTTFENVFRTYRAPLPLFLWTVLRLAHGAQAANQEAATLLHRRNFRGVVHVFGFGVDPGPLVPRRHALGRFVIGYVGRLAPEKGVDLLLEALGDLPDSVSLRIVGDGPAREALLALARQLGVTHRVHFTGGVAPEALGGELARMDTLVLPSRTTPIWKEQFGRVLIEAMASGLPIVGSDSGAIPEVVGDAGLIVPEGDPKALAKTLSQLVNDPGLRERLGAAGRARVQTVYSHERVAEATLALYRAAFGRGA